MPEQLGLYVGCNDQRHRCLRRYLSSTGLELQNVPSVQEAEEMVKMYPYCLILICFDTAHKDIFRFCSSICSDCPHAIAMVLMSKVRIDIEEQLFDCGVNDVVVGRQTSSRVLTKRILAHLRNSRGCWYQTNCVRLKDRIVDLDRREVRHNGTCYQLRGILADLLKYFLDNRNRVITRKELEQLPIWADSICTPADEGGKTFDVAVGKLRKLIEPDPARPQIIESVRGIGWKLITESKPWPVPY